MIDIKDIQGTTRFSTKINPGAKGKFSLMKEDYVVLPFSSPSPVDFQVGDYVDLRGVFDASMGGKLAKIYQIVDLSYPSYNASTGGYDYELRLDAYYWIWKTKIFKYTPETGGQEASWSLTASLDVQMGVFLRNLKALGYTYGGKDYTFSIDSTVENKAVAMTYKNMNLIDAMFSMADKWGCDCWVTDHVINFGRCEFSDTVKIELGKEAKDISRSDSKGTYATRIYAFGSTRNIPSNYRPVDQTTVVNGIVQKRLMLPKGTPYVDAYEGLSDFEAIEAVVVFDDIYPKRVGEITDVSSYESEVDNEDGTKTKATFYRFTDTGINFSKEYILEGQELKIKFESGKLNGMEFGVMFNPLGLTEKNDDDSWNPDAQLWEIVQNEDYGRPLPDEVLLPKIGDKYVLSGWNAEKITELGLVASAEQEVFAAAKKFVAKTCIDDGTYTATLNSIWVHKDQINHSFDVGQRINLINPAYFKAGRKSRVIGFEINLDLPYDSPQYVIGESTAYSRLSDIETQVEELTFKGQTFTGSGGSNIYVIKTNDSTAASNFNVFSALRTLSMFLRKDTTDVAGELITFLKGLLIGKNGSGITVRKDGTTQAVVDRLYVKIKAVFDELQVKKATHVGGEQIITHAGMKCIKVEELEDTYRCYFLAEQDGEAIANEFSVGSLAQAKECNIVEGTSLNASNRYYWREVMAVGRDYIDLSKTICDEGSDIPQAGDDIIGLGHRKDVDLQSAIVLSSTNETSPSITLYTGINDFNLTEKDVISFGVDKATGHAYMKVYGTSYVGARDGSTYIKYTPEGGVEIKGRFLTMAGEDIMTMFAVMEGLIKSEISSVRDEINALDNYLNNASFSSDTRYWTGSSKIRIFRVDGRLLYFNGNFYANKESFADIITYEGRSVLRLKNSSIMQYNSDFVRHPEFEEKALTEEAQVPVLDEAGNPVLDEAGNPVTETAEVPVLDKDGNPVTVKIPRQFYISFSCMARRRGILTVRFIEENAPGDDDRFEEYEPIFYREELLSSDEYRKIEIAGKWNGKGHFVLEFTGDMYLYSLALADNPLAELEEKFTMRFEATDKKIQANLDEIRKTGTKLEEYHSEFLLTARNLEIKFSEDLSSTESRITAAYKSYVNLTARDLEVKFKADINNAESRITEAYTSAIKLSAQGLQTKFTADLTDMEKGITAAYKSYVNLTAKNLQAGFTEDLTDLRTGLTEAYTSAIDLSARGLRTEFNSSISDLNGKLTTHTGSFHVTASKIEAMVSATDSISNKIASAGWITTADGNKLWATISTVNGIGNRLTTHEASFHVTATKIEGMVADITAQGTNYSRLTQTVNGITAEVNNVSGKYSSLKVQVDAIGAIVGDGSTGSFSEFQQTIDRLTAQVSDNKTAASGALAAAQNAQGKADSAYSKALANASAITQTNSSISAIAGRFNADGTLKEGAGWVTTADANTSWVKKDGVISAINQTAESVSINANKINLNGAVTANSRFKIKLDGSIEAADAVMNDVTVNNMTLNGSIFGANATLNNITANNLILKGNISGANAVLNDVTANGTINASNGRIGDYLHLHSNGISTNPRAFVTDLTDGTTQFELSKSYYLHAVGSNSGANTIQIRPYHRVDGEAGSSSSRGIVTISANVPGRNRALHVSAGESFFGGDVIVGKMYAPSSGTLEIAGPVKTQGVYRNTDVIFSSTTRYSIKTTDHTLFFFGNCTITLPSSADGHEVWIMPNGKTISFSAGTFANASGRTSIDGREWHVMKRVSGSWYLSWMNV